MLPKRETASNTDDFYDSPPPTCNPTIFFNDCFMQHKNYHELQVHIKSLSERGALAFRKHDVRDNSLENCDSGRSNHRFTSSSIHAFLRNSFMCTFDKYWSRFWSSRRGSCFFFFGLPDLNVSRQGQLLVEADYNLARF